MRADGTTLPMHRWTDALTSSPVPNGSSTSAMGGDADAGDSEFADPITREVIVDPVVGSDGLTYDRLTAYKLVKEGSFMPGSNGAFSFAADNVNFRSRLRAAHPETWGAMQQQRQDCLEVRCDACVC